jgi:hypothetical protein
MATSSAAKGGGLPENPEGRRRQDFGPGGSGGPEGSEKKMRSPGGGKAREDSPRRARTNSDPEQGGTRA